MGDILLGRQQIRQIDILGPIKGLLIQLTIPQTLFQRLDSFSLWLMDKPRCRCQQLAGPGRQVCPLPALWRSVRSKAASGTLVAVPRHLVILGTLSACRKSSCKGSPQSR